ncbi:MAG: TonB-dependent receptor, partial [Pseudomonadota bacterium]
NERPVLVSDIPTFEATQTLDIVQELDQTPKYDLESLGLFAQATWDISDQFALTLGARWYDIEVDFDGSANSSFCNSGAAQDINGFGTDISDLYNGDGEITFRGTCNPDAQITYTLDTIDENTPAQVVSALQNAPDAATTDGVIGKATLTWTPNDNLLFYGTWSEGFRPGLLNRPGGAAGPNGFTVPFALDTDDVVNIEFGWKLDLFDRALRFNGSAFVVDIENLQTTIFDPSITNLFFSDNAADAEIRGIEGDFIWAPRNVSGLTVSGGFSFLDTEITEVLTPTNDVREGDELAFAPEFQATLRTRYEWEVGGDGLTAHFMPFMSYSSEAFSDIITINRDEMDSWALFGVTAGVTSDRWAAEVYVDNLFNAQAELARNFINDVERVTYARPLTGGVRVRFGF